MTTQDHQPRRVSALTKAALFVLAGLIVGLSPTRAHAAKRQPRGVITLAEVTITGRIQKPIAAVDVARIRPKLTLSELRQPFAGRIAKAMYKAPF